MTATLGLVALTFASSIASWASSAKWCGIDSFTARASGITLALLPGTPLSSNHESLGRQWPPTPEPGMCMSRNGQVLTRRRTSKASAPSFSQSNAISFANAIWTSR